VALFVSLVRSAAAASARTPWWTSTTAAPAALFAARQAAGALLANALASKVLLVTSRSAAGNVWIFIRIQRTVLAAEMFAPPMFLVPSASASAHRLPRPSAQSQDVLTFSLTLQTAVPVATSVHLGRNVACSSASKRPSSSECLTHHGQLRSG